jgi:glucose/mannose-6-phosphate isomerase
MNLDDWASFKSLDAEDMLAKIEGLPDQLLTAWQLGQGMPLPKKTGIERVVIAGMGGSAIGADLLASSVSASCRLPVFVHRDYGLPGWARGPETLWIGSSHSGNTEETLDSLEAAVQNRCRMLVLCTGGELARRAIRYGVPLWQFEHSGPPRAAVGFSFGLLLAAFARLKLVPSQEEEVADAIASMRRLQQGLRPEVGSAQNPSKRLAGELVGRWVNVFASGPLSSVARRWKTQINELAKAGASFEVLPEADHNTLAGTLNPSAAKSQTVTIFLRAPTDHPRNKLRLALTQQGFTQKGLATQSYEAPGETALAHLWTTLIFGDFTAYYLAMAYEVDPTPIAALEELKAQMKASA